MLEIKIIDPKTEPVLIENPIVIDDLSTEVWITGLIRDARNIKNKNYRRAISTFIRTMSETQREV